MSILDGSIREIMERVHNKEVSASELVEASIARIQEVDDKVKAFITLDEEKARNHAKQLDEALNSSEEKGTLFGLPVGLKDNIVTKGLKTTCASKMLENFDPVYDATVVEKLRTHQAVTIGKLNMDEFGFGSSTELSSFYPTRNPWNTEFVPGGSSGGPAASVASGEVVFALGSDTGGSLRQPAAYCGVVGMKPTYGRISRYGIVPVASSFDQVGAITRTVEDNAYVLQAIAGHDPLDTMSVNIEVPNYLSALTGDVKGLKIAVPKEYLGEDVSEEVRNKVQEALKVLEGSGATVEEVSLPHTKYAVAAFNLISSGEASANLSRFDGIRYGYRTDNATNLLELYKQTRSEGFGDEVKRQILLGTHVLSSGNYEIYYKKAQKVRTLIKQDFENIFANYDVVIGPTTPTTAYKFGEKVNHSETMSLTVSANLAGTPAISVPCGFGENNLPIGLQIIGKHFDESTVYQVAHAFEQATDHHKVKPEL